MNLSRRRMMEAFAGAAVYPAATSEDEEFDAIQKHREMFIESDGSKDIHPIPLSQTGFMELGAGPLSLNSEEGDAEMAVFFPADGSMGVRIEASNDEVSTRTLARLTLDEARTLRDTIDDTIEILEGQE